MQQIGWPTITQSDKRTTLSNNHESTSTRIKTMSDEKTQIDVLWLCFATGTVGSIAGVAALLRSTGELDRRAFWTAVTNSGMFSIAIAALTISYLGYDHLLLAIGLSILSGLGGNTLIDFTIGMVQLWMKNRFEKKYGKGTSDDPPKSDS